MKTQNDLSSRVFKFVDIIGNFAESYKAYSEYESRVACFSEAKLRAWYKMIDEEVRIKLVTPYFKDWFYRVLDNLNEIPNKDTMLRNSVADGSVHISERGHIALAERYWNLR